jgi:carboxymethylenebutenolidase
VSFCIVWELAATGISAVACVLLGCVLVAGPAAAGDGGPGVTGPLFLDVFRVQEQPVIERTVNFARSPGQQRASLFRPKSDERLPALLLLAIDQSDQFFAQTARELAGIGYVVLLVPFDKDPHRHERTMAEIGSAARWLRSQSDVFPDKIGVLGWGTGARRAFECAARQSLQAAVLADLDLPLAVDAQTATGLKRAAVLVIRGKSTTLADRQRLARLDRDFGNARVVYHVLELPNVESGFMDKRRGKTYQAKAADRAWFEIYEFLGRHVEDADVRSPIAGDGRPQAGEKSSHFASIREAMRAVNGPSGVRTEIAHLLNDPLADNERWSRLHDRAARMVDCGAWLFVQQPSKGTAASWIRHAAAYRDAATALVVASERRRLAESRRAFERVNQSCTQCHANHR